MSPIFCSYKMFTSYIYKVLTLLRRSSIHVYISLKFAYTGLPIYNVLALNYTPLLIKHIPAKRKGHSRQLELKDNINATNAVSAIAVSVVRVSQQNEVREPPRRKLKTSDPELELHVQSHATESNTRAAICDVEPPLTAHLVHTNTGSLYMCTAQSPCGNTRQRNPRKLRRKAGLMLAIHTRRKLLTRKRKQLASRVKKQANGERCKLMACSLQLFGSLILVGLQDLTIFSEASVIRTRKMHYLHTHVHTCT